MDYYTAKRLRVYYTEFDYLTIELARINARRHNGIDEDDENYEEKKKEFLEKWIGPMLAQPITIYRNGSFTKLLCETKYKTMIENKIKYHNIVNSSVAHPTKFSQSPTNVLPEVFEIRPSSQQHSDETETLNSNDHLGSTITWDNITKIIKVEEAGIY
jgi:hypothetical protein